MITPVKRVLAAVLKSSVWEEDDATRLVWVTLMLIADREGHVESTIPALAELSRQSIPAVEKAINRFLKTKDEHQIEATLFGWRIVNYAAIKSASQAQDDKEYRKKYMRQYMKDVRESVSNTKRRHQAPPTHGDEQFERCWVAFRRIGAKTKSWAYWKKLKPEDRDAIEATIPAYLKCVDAGRLQKQFDGWINPANRLWEQDWQADLTMRIQTGRPRSRHVGGNPDFSANSTDPFVLAARKTKEKMEKKHGLH